MNRCLFDNVEPTEQELTTDEMNSWDNLDYNILIEPDESIDEYEQLIEAFDWHF
jgi:hypothetical protein